MNSPTVAKLGAQNLCSYNLQRSGSTIESQRRHFNSTTEKEFVRLCYYGAIRRRSSAPSTSARSDYFKSPGSSKSIANNRGTRTHDAHRADIKGQSRPEASAVEQDPGSRRIPERSNSDQPLHTTAGVIGAEGDAHSPRAREETLSAPTAKSEATEAAVNVDRELTTKEQPFPLCGNCTGLLKEDGITRHSGLGHHIKNCTYNLQEDGFIHACLGHNTREYDLRSCSTAWKVSKLYH